MRKWKCDMELPSRVFFNKISAFSRESKGNAFQNPYFYVFQLPQLKFQQFLVNFVYFRMKPELEYTYSVVFQLPELKFQQCRLKFVYFSR